jgi:mannose-1-phosphate guanylyltransferase/mannose-6-phosphate isomerase
VTKPIPHLYAVVLAGGSGTRFWPLSRELYPKQLLKVLSNRTLIQQTVLRVRPIGPAERTLVVTGASHADGIRIQLDGADGVPKENLLIEPVARNTAAAIGWAAEAVRRLDPDGIMLVMPADHVIPDEKKFLRTVALGVQVAQAGKLVTFGIKPTRPETGYGYIKAAGRRPLLAQGGLKALAVARFVEKPDLPTAKRYLRAGGFYWNSGIFVWRADTILEEMATALPKLARGLRQLGQALGTSNETQALDRFYKTAESISIDHGVLQRSRRAAVIPAPFRWSDVGNWSSLNEVADTDRDGNIRIGRIVDLGSRDSVLYGEHRLVATIGLKDMVVVDTADATLVCPKDRAQDVKQVVELLRKQKAPEHLIHKTVHRPWGSYTVLEDGPRYKVKRVSVKPGGRLSLQYHHRRSEHWVVTAGTARVTCGERVFDLHVNESTGIPTGTPHRLENPGPVPLDIIEVQCGDYVGEDDIVRLADDYGRAQAPLAPSGRGQGEGQ